ncbi:MAG: hypothetical protein ACXWDN_19940, partial [Limisphaerales bacterium]
DDIDHQLINGLNLVQSFHVAVGQIGSASSINTEFKKVTVMNTKTTEKIIGAVGYSVFAVLSVCGLFSDVVGASTTEKLLGLAAVALTGALLFASAHIWRFLPIIAVKSVRMTVAITFAILGALLTAYIFHFVMPKFDLTIPQITVTVLWALQPLIIGALIFGGLIEAADHRHTSAT